MRSTKRVLAVGSCLAILTAGCGAEAEVNVGGRTFDDAEIEPKISSGLAADVGQTPKSVDCPEDAPADEGDTFECTGTAPAGDQFTIEVTVGADGEFDAFVPPEQFEK